MPNLSALSTNTTRAAGLANLVLVTPTAVLGYQPQNPLGSSFNVETTAPPAAFLFDYEGEQSITIECDITDHYVEDNTAVQDQIAIKPTMFSTHGFIGELNDVVPSFLKPLKFAADKLTVIQAYSPVQSETAQLAYATAFQAYQAAESVSNSAVQAWNSLSGQENQNKQQTAFNTFYGYIQSRTLFTIQTPWALLKNMAIKSLRPVQDAETDVITDFELTFKQINYAKISSVLSDALISYSGQLNYQAQPQTDNGISSGVSVA